jgi:hypothetical protein
VDAADGTLRPDRYYRYTAEDLTEMEANGDEKEVNEDVYTAVNKRCAPFTDIDSLLIDSMIEQAKL